MKTTKITLFIAVLFFAASCKKDDVKPTTTSLDNVQLSLAAQSQIVAAPTALAASNDTHAAMANEWIGEVNAMTSYLTYLKPPSNAVKTTTTITAKNGRVATAGDHETWTWSDGQGNSVAYQVSETTDSYVFEVFLKLSGQADYLKYFHAEEKKDKSSGEAYVFDVFDTDPSIKILDRKKKKYIRAKTFHNAPG